MHREQTTQTGSVIKEGQMVVCNADNIAGTGGKGLSGRVTGFARFSSYHGREVCVQFADSTANYRHGGWFWLGDVSPVEINQSETTN